MKEKLTLPFIFCFVFLLTIQNGFSQMVDNKAATFNGTSSYIAIPNQAEINPTTAITLEAWIFVNAYGANPQLIIGKNYQTSYSFGILNTGKLAFYPKGPSGFFPGKGLIPVNTWTHVATTYNGSVTAFYINGVFDTSSTAITGAITTNTDSLYIGCDRNGTTPAYFFNGMIDNPRIWNRKDYGRCSKGYVYIFDYGWYSIGLIYRINGKLSFRWHCSGLVRSSK